MHLTTLTIRHFRNLQGLDLQPAPGVNLVWGDNGQGKTNLLEALHLGLTGRSFRTRRDEELLPWNRSDDPAHPTLVQLDLARASGTRRLRLTMGRGWKRAFADATLLPTLAELMREAAVVTFTPEDVGLLRDAPSDRRRWLDMLLCQLAPAYLDALQRYTRALKQSSLLVRRAAAGATRAREELRAFYPALAAAGSLILREREQRLRQAGDSLAERWNELGGAGRLDLLFDPDLAPARAADEAGYLVQLEQAEAAMLHAGTVSCGVHRDDFGARLDGHDLRKFGSQGQHRLAALALKLEAAEWLRAAHGEPPILLLDDFGSELDPGRRAAVLGKLRGALQIFITATSPGDLGPSSHPDAQVRIEGGRLV